MNSKIHVSMILSLSLILLLQSPFLPISLSCIFLVMLGCLCWTLSQQIILAKVWKFMITGFAFLSIYWSYKSFLGVDAGVAVLSTCLFAKALETKNTRDFIVLFNFTLFVAASSFLFSQSFLMALGVLLCLMSCFIGLYRIQVSEFKRAEQKYIQGLKQDAQHIGQIILFAIPFFIVLFLFFPRLPPLWHIPIPDNKAVTGMSDRMSPGDIAQLSQSSALAFRIIGDIQQLPPRSELYWRALVLDEYNGQKWSSHFTNQQPIQLKQKKFNESREGWDYQYLATDPSVRWIMGLEQSIPLERRYYNQYDGGIIPYRLMQRVEPIRLRWIGQNELNFTQNLKSLQDVNTRVPADFDPKAQELARFLWMQSQYHPTQYIQRVLQWYKDHQFIYTLTPGTLGQHRIDEFLLSSKQGFCEHYASSFVMLMRYVGIPARVVVGYQGGQLAPDGRSWEVRQFDAHAWTEVFIDHKWQRIDPTAIIAPQRIDHGMQDLIAQDLMVLGDASRWNMQRYAIFTQLRIWSDYASYQWQSKIVGYNAEAQKSWLSKLGLSSNYTVVLALFLSIVLMGIGYFLWTYYRLHRDVSLFDRAILNFNKQLSTELKKEWSESFKQWMTRLLKQVKDEERQCFVEVIAIYERNRYSNAVGQRQDPQNFKKMLKKCSYVLKRSGKGLS